MSTTARAIDASLKSREGLVWSGVLVALVFLLYAPILKPLVLQW